MAIMKGPIKLTGKLKSAGIVFVQGRNGIHTRAIPAPGGEKDDKFIYHMDQAGAVNKLAGQVNSVFHFYAPRNTTGRMYADLLGILRKAGSHERFVHINRLIGVDGHPGNRVEHLHMEQRIGITENEKDIAVSVDYARHPPMPKPNNYYRIQMIAVWWKADGAEPLHAEQHSKWTTHEEEIRGYDFVFEIPEGSTNYMLMFCCVHAEEKGTKRLPPSHILQIVHAGSFIEEEVLKLEQYKEELQAAKEQAPIDYSEEDDGAEGRVSGI